MAKGGVQMKKLVSFGASLLLTASFLDAFFNSGMGRPIPWARDVIVAVLGVVCYYILFRKRYGSPKTPDPHIWQVEISAEEILYSADKNYNIRNILDNLPQFCHQAGLPHH
jgi:hypothetical protein